MIQLFRHNCSFAGVFLLFCFTTSGAEVAAPQFKPEDRSHWAFQPLSRVTPPLAVEKGETKNGIDAFILKELASKKLTLSPPADKATLLRRASLDLTGLPPSPEEVDRFLADTSPKAWEKVIARLLASPHYGERWARHWLDLARYAESEGFKADETRPHAWRYRDYVINSFNADKPYDRFLTEQIAGDELWPEDPDAKVATAFNRHYPDESNARNLMQRRQEILNDITDTVGAVFTGMTYACARCHDHKFDPILQADYYRLQAFFAHSAAADQVPLLSKEKLAAYQKQLSEWEEKTREIRHEMERIEEPERNKLVDDYLTKYPEEIQAILKKKAEDRTPFEQQMTHKAMQYLDPRSREFVGTSSAVAGRLKGEKKTRYEALKKELESFKETHPGELPMASALADIGAESPKTYLLRRGAYDSPREEIAPGFLSVLNSAPATVRLVPKSGSTGRRAALASILTDPKNPLTARVMVNRVWHYHFGRGIVATPSDFGVKGERPSHPELLDWLAGEFMRQGWSMKKLHQLIMTSATYQQSTRHRPEAAAVDPDNKLLWHFPRQRLEGEVIRDAALKVSGLLNSKMGGPSIFPELPEGMNVRGGWKVNPEDAERNRRSVYVFVRRNTRYPMFEAFDMPDTHESCSRRNTTTSPTQALTLLNSEVSLKWAQALAGKVLQLAGTDRRSQVNTAFRLAYSRSPDSTEQKLVENYFIRHSSILAARAESQEPMALPTPASGGLNAVEGATLVDFCHMLLNANEFVYRN